MQGSNFDTGDFIRRVSDSVGGLVGYLEHEAEHRADLSDDGPNQKRGPHPVHGSSTGTNFVVDTDKGVWHCKRHQEGSGGGILELIAVDRGLVECQHSADLSGPVWTDVLEVAADVAGLEFDVDPGDKGEMREWREERNRLDETMAAVQEFYRASMDNTDVDETIRERYGFGDETIKAAGIGYAPASANGRAMVESVDVSEERLLEAGLAVERNGRVVDYFQGRIMMPYYENGNVRYFIGRETRYTPEWESAKYRKIRKPDPDDDENPISVLVSEPVYGVDSIRGKTELVVTEGITDAIALHAHGIPAIAPVTTQFKADRVDDVARAVTNKSVTVVMDEDADSEAGLLGAVKTAHTLSETGEPSEVYHGRLPGEDVDVADYMRSHTAEEFRESVLSSAVPSEVAWWAHGDGKPVGLFEAAMRENGHSPHCATTRTNDDGDTVPVPVKQVVNSADIGNAITQFRCRADALDGKERNQVLLDACWWYLTTKGDFFRTPDDVVYYFHAGEVEVYRVTPEQGQQSVSSRMRALLTTSLDILPDTTAMNVFSNIADRAAREAPERAAYTLSHYDRDEETLYITDFENGYYALDGERVEHRRNGTDVFFIPDDRAEQYEYVDESERERPDRVLGELDHNRRYSSRGDLVERVICNRVNFDPSCILGRMLQYRQLYLHLHTIPFGSLMNGRPIAAFVGEKGSGKTVVMRSIGRFFYGAEWTESAWPSKQEDFVAKVTNSSLAFFDNYDDGVDWANDSLASIATGTGLEMRQLYTTNDVRRVQPDCWIGITSRDPPFRRDDVADRMLVTRMKRVDGEKIGMGMYLDVVSQWRDVVWSDYLDNLNRIVAHMQAVDRGEYSSSHRMADWAIQALMTAEALDIPLTDHDENDLFDAISKERAAFALEDKPALQAGITAMLKQYDDPEIRGIKFTATELLEELRNAAQEHGVSMDSYNPSRLGRDLSQYESELDEIYGFEVMRDSQQNKYVFTSEKTQQAML